MSTELVKALRAQAIEIANERHAGWGNTMTWAADEMTRMQEEIAALNSKGCTHNSQVYLEEVIARRNEEIAALKKERAVDAILKNSADKLTGDLWEKIAELESYANDQDENIGAMIKTEATLQAENANLTSELARSREALLREWREKGSFSHGLTVAAEIAREKYNREIAQQGEEG